MNGSVWKVSNCKHCGKRICQKVGWAWLHEANDLTYCEPERPRAEPPEVNGFGDPVIWDAPEGYRPGK